MAGWSWQSPLREIERTKNATKSHQPYQQQQQQQQHDQLLDKWGPWWRPQMGSEVGNPNYGTAAESNRPARPRWRGNPCPEGTSHPLRLSFSQVQSIDFWSEDRVGRWVWKESRRVFQDGSRDRRGWSYVVRRVSPAARRQPQFHCQVRETFWQRQSLTIAWEVEGKGQTNYCNDGSTKWGQREEKNVVKNSGRGTKEWWCNTFEREGPEPLDRGKERREMGEKKLGKELFQWLGFEFAVDFVFYCVVSFGGLSVKFHFICWHDACPKKKHSIVAKRWLDKKRQWVLVDQWKTLHVANSASAPTNFVWRHSNNITSRLERVKRELTDSAFSVRFRILYPVHEQQLVF